MLGPILFLLTCAGLLCLVRGLAGRRIGERPRCAACGYDLSGVEMEVDFCPECGGAIGPAGSVVVGRRRPMWTLAIAGAALTLLGLGGAGVNLWAAATGFDWIRTRSFDSLIGERGAPPGARESDELLRRLAAGELGRAETDRLIRAVASQQPGSGAARWVARVSSIAPLLSDPDDLDALHSALIDAYLALPEQDRAAPDGMLLRRVIEREYASGRLGERAGAYFRTLIDVSLKIDPIVSGWSSELRYAVAFRHLPSTESSPRLVTVDLVSRTEGFEVDVPAAEIRWDIDWHAARARGRARDWTVGVLTTSLPPGRHQLRLGAVVTLREAPLARAVELTIPLERTVTILPPGPSHNRGGAEDEAPRDR